MYPISKILFAAMPPGASWRSERGGSPGQLKSKRCIVPEEGQSKSESPGLNPAGASPTLTRSNSSTSMALGEYRDEGASSGPPVSSDDSPEGLVSVLNNPEPLPVTASPTVGPQSMSVELKEALDHASSLLNDGQSTAAMHSLASVAERLPEAQNQYAYHSRYGQALLGHIDGLNTQGRIGQIELNAAIVEGHVAISELTAERIGCYVGVCGSYGKFLQLLSEPNVRQDFIEKNSEATLAECEGGVKQGLIHSILEIRLFVNRLTQCNSNKASTSFMNRMVEAGRLSEGDQIVRSFREVQTDPLYNQFTEVGHDANIKLDQTGEPHTLVWMNWGQQEQKRCYAIPEVASALAHPGVAAILGASFC